MNGAIVWIVGAVVGVGAIAWVRARRQNAALQRQHEREAIRAWEDEGGTTQVAASPEPA